MLYLSDLNKFMHRSLKTCGVLPNLGTSVADLRMKSPYLRYSQISMLISACNANWYCFARGAHQTIHQAIRLVYIVVVFVYFSVYI